MRKQNLRKVKWDRERNRAYVVRDEVRYWAPVGAAQWFGGDEVQVFNPDGKSVMVKCGSVRETWRADATSQGSGG